MDDSLLQLGIAFHGHKCPAMPLGIRVGLAAMEALGVERADNKELYCMVENGPAHAAACFADGVQVATGCTYGKSNMEKLNIGKNAIRLIDVATKRAVRVTLKPDFFGKALGSEFVKMRKQGIEPKDIPAEIVDPLVERVWMLPAKDIMIVGDVYEVKDWRPPKGTFEWRECEGCGEVVFAHGLHLKDGKLLCTDCAEAV